jgi:hypothetical protein
MRALTHRFPFFAFVIAAMLGLLACETLGETDITEDSSAFGGEMPGDGEMPPPPEEAFEACDGLDIGDYCDFEGFEGELVEGTCEEIEGEVVCFPEDAPLPPEM